MGKIIKFWNKGKWQKFVVILICMMIIGAIGDAIGISYTTINDIKVNDISLTSGESKEVKFNIDPDDYEVEIVSTEIKVENKDIAKVVNNKVVGLNEGETKLQIIIKDNHDNIVKSNKAKITVKLNPEEQKAKEKAELEKKRNSISTSEGIRIKGYCEDIVKSILKAPSTAEFPGGILNPLENWKMNKKNNLVTVASYVDAQNSFGAQLRSEFLIQIKMNDDGSGKVTYVQLDGEVVSGQYQK